MIPPIQEVRLRSIRRWMKDQQPERYNQLLESGELDDTLFDLDVLMDEAFEEAESELMERLNRSDRWGTFEGMQEFRMERLLAWQESVSVSFPF